MPSSIIRSSWRYAHDFPMLYRTGGIFRGLRQPLMPSISMCLLPIAELHFAISLSWFEYFFNYIAIKGSLQGKNQQAASQGVQFI
jgi:hypothetical protein